ncbi:FecR family protein [Massilia sp.]|uniref:FecR family protein n=1 Tax=Massilia sp. TaxID=1882437 RepID=UPI00289947E3|nr:FecR domain-containing protein [Massilia sp.]
MSAPIPAHVAQRAVEWMIALQEAHDGDGDGDGAGDAARREWQRWRAADPDHERAWQRIESVNARLHAVGAPQPAIAALLAPRATPEHPERRRQAVKTLAVALFAGGAAWMVRDSTPWQEWSAAERTAAGQRRTLALADGTRIDLNTASALDVDADADADADADRDSAMRRLRMAAGEILVTAAPGAAPPLTVDTRHGSVHTAGARFAVRLHRHAAQVSVFAGAAEVRAAGDGAARWLQAGEQAFVSRAGMTLPQAADEDSVAWVDGYLIARSQGLRAFLAELERYGSIALDCAPALASRRVSGSYRLDDVRRVLQTVAAALDLGIEARPGFLGRGIARIRLVPRTA